MEKKVVFCLIILCGIMTQGICTSSEETENSSDLHIRKKRLIGYKSHIGEAPFLVSLVTNGRNYCPATLLTESVAITSAECFQEPSPRGWLIKASTSYHQVANVIPYGNYNSSHPTVNNLVLAFFHPPINYYATYNQPIRIYSRDIAAVGEDKPEIFNWDHKTIAGQRHQSTTNLEKVILQLISYEYCRDYYRNGIVKQGNICTQSSTGGRQCQHMDTGAPLVLQQELLGIFAYRGQNCETNPDVFMNLKDHDIRLWIHEHVPALRLF